MKKKIAEVIAEKLARLIDESDMVQLPPMRRLARTHGVSLASINTAISILKRKNLVEGYQGGCVRVIGREMPVAQEEPQEARPSSADSLYESIKVKITNGTFKMGHQLPKIAYYATTARVSHHAVTAAYRRLANENLVHKEGKAWFSGPKVRQINSITITSQPVILVLQTHEGFWSYMARRPFFEEFCRRFQNEIENYSVQLMPVVFDEKITSLGVFAAGKKAVMELIRHLDTRYLGCLIINGMGEVSEFESWIADLLRMKRPVVWFDRLKERPPIRYKSPLFFRCHEADKHAVSLTIELLQSLGHRRIAFPHYRPYPWIANRTKLLRSAAERFGPDGPHIVCSEDADAIFASENIREQAAFLDSLRSSPIPFIRAAFDSIDSKAASLLRMVSSNAPTPRRNRSEALAMLLGHIVKEEDLAQRLFPNQPTLPWVIILAPVLAPLLQAGDITAIIAPNDASAHVYYLWLKAAGISIPRDMSLISFDNLWFLQDLPITSVDFGYGYLGFAAFHLIAQDVSIKHSEFANVAAEPRIVHRGTVDKPRSRPLQTAVADLDIFRAARSRTI